MNPKKSHLLTLPPNRLLQLIDIGNTWFSTRVDLGKGRRGPPLILDLSTVPLAELASFRREFEELGFGEMHGATVIFAGDPLDHRRRVRLNRQDPPDALWVEVLE